MEEQKRLLLEQVKRSLEDLNYSGMDYQTLSLLDETLKAIKRLSNKGLIRLTSKEISDLRESQVTFISIIS